ncbi:MAG: pneumococcal-type histidine triad protein [Erysipelotrichaceae bacterium]|nr:pneumococcal-type histidine triad protein [Erysipelotrichaceae bacterium]
MKIKYYIFLFFSIFIITSCTNTKKENSNHLSLSKDEIKKRVETALSAKDLQFIDEKTVTIENSSDHIIMIDDDKYVYIDLSSETPKVYKLQPKDIASLKVVEVYDDGYVVKHGDHFDYIKGKLPAGKKVGDYVQIKDPHASSKETTEKKDEKQVNKTNTNIIKDNDDGYVFNMKDVIKETENGYIVKHNDHLHFIYKNKNNASQNNKKDETTKTTTTPLKNKYDDIIEYISKFHGVDKKDITIEGEYIVYPHHDHHHTIKISDIKIPNSSNDPEKDFEEELESLAKQMNVSAESIIIEDGYMKIPHGDHMHSYKISSIGWRDYVKNKIPPITHEYIAGELDRNVVKQATDKLIQTANEKLKDNPKQLRRVLRVLKNFAADLDWGDNSTKGYLNALESFNRKYINSDVQIQNDEVEKLSYEKLLEKVTILKRNLNSSHPKYTELSTKLNSLENDISYRFEKEEKLSLEIKQIASEINITNNDSSKVNDLKSKYEILLNKIRAIDENTNLAKKLELLNEINSIDENNTDMRTLLKIEEKFNNLSIESESNKDKELLNYINLNKDDKRLSETIKEKINSTLASSYTTKQLEELKSSIKNEYKTFEEKETRYSRLSTNLISEISSLINSIHNDNLKQNLTENLNQLKSDLNSSALSKEATYNNILEFSNYVKKEIEKQTNNNQPNDESISSEDNKPADIHDMPLNDLEKQEVQEIITFINNNKRNIPDSADKANKLNYFYTLESDFESEIINQWLLQELRKLKAEIEPILVENTTPEENSGW